jgi:peptidoglycan hydrolase-like protein with peptidoglycan-binding domain
MIASGSYTGVYNASYDCVRALAGGGNSLSSKTNLLMKPEGLSLSIIGDAASYIGSDIGLATLQLKLASAGVLAESDITGQYTIQTFEGIKAFQTKNKLPATGFPDEKTITLLNSIQFSKTTITGITKTLYEVKTSISQQPTQTIITPTPGKQTDTVLPKSSTEAPGTTPKTVPAR